MKSRNLKVRLWAWGKFSSFRLPVLLVGLGFGLLACGPQMGYYAHEGHTDWDGYHVHSDGAGGLEGHSGHRHGALLSGEGSRREVLHWILDMDHGNGRGARDWFSDGDAARGRTSEPRQGHFHGVAAWTSDGHHGHPYGTGAMRLYSEGNGNTFSTSDGIVCDQEVSQANVTTVRIEGDFRVIRTNSLPDHPVGAFPNAGNPHRIAAQQKTYRIPAKPEMADRLTSLSAEHGMGQGMPNYEFGVGTNGIVMEPTAAEPFVNRRTGERNWSWVREALSTNVNLGDDCNNAHVQPGGKYHYHGTPHGITQAADGNTMFLTGWAADGFPIYYKWGHQEAINGESGLVELRSSYRLRKGQRPGDGVTAPDGAYDGTFVRDFVYLEGAGDLDEANGRFGVTPEFPRGTYYYVITDDFPSIPRFLVGTPSQDFAKGPGGMGSPGMNGPGMAGPGMGPGGRQGPGGMGPGGTGRPGNAPGPGGNQFRPDGQQAPNGFGAGGQRPPEGFAPAGQQPLNGNGRPQGPPTPSQVLQDLDRNEDGQLSREEVRGPLVQEFDQVDENGNGQLSRKELQRFFRNHQPPQGR